MHASKLLSEDNLNMLWPIGLIFYTQVPCGRTTSAVDGIFKMTAGSKMAIVFKMAAIYPCPEDNSNMLWPVGLIFYTHVPCGGTTSSVDGIQDGCQPIIKMVTICLCQEDNSNMLWPIGLLFYTHVPWPIGITCLKLVGVQVLLLMEFSRILFFQVLWHR